ncbi:MAG: hypothetical protein WCH11_03020 [Bdellovibrio sp.]
MKKFLTLASFFVFSQSAFALFELRGGYGVHSGTMSTLNTGLNTFSQCGEGCNASGTMGFNFDALVSPWPFGLGLGLRQENFQTKFSFSPISTDITYKFSRLALLLNYRLIDTLIYFGPIASFGLSGSSSLDTGILGISRNANARSTSSYSLGLEGGVKLLGFSAGLELGYSSLVGSDYVDSNSSVLTVGGTSINNLGLSGTYVKAILGFGF